MPCRRTCRSHSRLFVKQRPQNSQGRRFSALLGPELLWVLLVGDARTSGKYSSNLWSVSECTELIIISEIIINELMLAPAQS